MGRKKRPGHSLISPPRLTGTSHKDCHPPGRQRRQPPPMGAKEAKQTRGGGPSPADALLPPAQRPRASLRFRWLQENRWLQRPGFYIYEWKFEQMLAIKMAYKNFLHTMFAAPASFTSMGKRLIKRVVFDLRDSMDPARGLCGTITEIWKEQRKNTL